MKKIILTVLLLTAFVHGKDFYAKVEPYEVYTISSNINGVVTYLDIAKEGSLLDENIYLAIDSVLDEKEMSSISKKIKLLENSIKLNRSMEINYKDIISKKEKNYNQIKDLKIKSNIEKDREFYDLISSKNSLISIQKEIQNSTVQINDLNLHKQKLLKSISDKKVSSKGMFLYKLLVKQGEMVTPTTRLAQVADISKAKLTLFLSEIELKDIKKKTVYINNLATNYKISQLWKVSDETHLSSYKVEIITDAPEIFSKIVTIAFKNNGVNDEH
jgi:hypothetical protein